MAEIQWIKITTDIFDDEKIRLIETLPESDTLLVIWLKLLTMAGKCNDCGLVYLTRDIPYNEEMLSTILRRPVNTVRLALHEFQKLGMIAVVDSFISILNWEKHQNIEGMERVKELRKLRNKRYYEKSKLIENKTSYKTVQDTLDKSREDKNRKEKKKKRSTSFIKPSVEDIRLYLNERNIKHFTPDGFYDFYESKGWMVGKNKMKDWKAAVRTWERSQKPTEKKVASAAELRANMIKRGEM